MKENNFKAFVIETKLKKGIKLINKDFLKNGDVFVKISYSSFNYKDGLAISGKMPIVKEFPMIPGVDFTGEVLESSHKKYKVGDKVILNGWGVGEKHFGGFSKFARVKGNWLIHLPKKISPKQSMIIGSAGYTAALCVMELIKKIKPTDGDILITGASGGVGSIAVHLLSQLNYNVIVISGKKSDFLSKIGAKKIIDRNKFLINEKPLNKQKWAGCIDTLGGDILSMILSEMKYNGVVASTGLARSHILNTTVFPFILRNITLTGIDCVYTDYKKRVKAWNFLEKNLDLKKLNLIFSEKSLKDLVNLSKAIIKGKVKGRVIINLNL
jgi:acrylyl-CoA reductase (NADPH)